MENKQTNITVCVFNLENFYLDGENFINEFQTPPKPQEKIEALVNVFNDINADIYCLSEIGGVKSLEIFNIDYLSQQYNIYITPGNSDRGIEVGFLVKKNFPYKVIFHSNKDEKFKIKFNENKTIKTNHSRDLTELHLIDDESILRCIIFNTHLKSQRESYNEDFRGQKRRGAEFNFSVDKLLSYEIKHKNCPIFITGDLNGNASRFQTDPEFIRGIVKADLIDVLDTQDLPRENRATYYIFQGSKKIPIQLDYALFNRIFKDKITDATVYRYKNDQQNLKFLPQSKIDVTHNPSDHYPLVFTLLI